MRRSVHITSTDPGLHQQQEDLVGAPQVLGAAELPSPRAGSNLPSAKGLQKTWDRQQNPFPAPCTFRLLQGDVSQRSFCISQVWAAHPPALPWAGAAHLVVSLCQLVAGGHCCRRMVRCSA